MKSQKDVVVKGFVQRGAGRQRQRGYSVIEMGIVLALAAIAIGALAWVSVGLFTNTALNTESQKLQSMTNALYKYSQSSPDTSGFSTAMAIAIQAVSPDSVTGTVINSKVGGSITVAPATLVAANDAFSINYSAVKKAACVSFVKDNGQAFDTVVVNGTNVKTTTDTGVTDAVATACAAANAVVFTKSKA